MRRIILQILAYIFYALLVFVGYLYLTFPYDLVRQRLSDSLARQGVQVALARLEPAFPLGLRARDVRFRGEHEQDVMQMSTLAVYPDWGPLLTGVPQVHFIADLYRGQVDGHLRAVRSNEGKGWDVQATFANLDMAQHPLAQRGGQTFVKGRGRGDLRLAITPAGTVRSAEVRLQVQALTLSPQALQLPIQRDIVCQTVQGTMSLDPQQTSNLSLSCMGEDLSIATEGTVQWQTPLANSQLNLTWKIRSDTAYKQELDLLGTLVRQRNRRGGELNFKMQGPLQRPRVGA